MPCCLSRAQAPLEQVRLQPPSGVSDRAEARVVALRLGVANTFCQKLHRTAGLYAFGSLLPVTEVTFDLPLPGRTLSDFQSLQRCLKRVVLRRAQTHHCRVTRVPPPWRIGGTEHTAGTLSAAGGQPSPQGGFCLRSLGMGLESVTSSISVVQSSESTKPLLQLGHQVRRGQHLCLRVQ